MDLVQFVTNIGSLKMALRTGTVVSEEGDYATVDVTSTLRLNSAAPEIHSAPRRFTVLKAELQVAHNDPAAQ